MKYKLLLLVVSVLGLPLLVSANYYTLPIDEPDDSDISYYSHFDHDTGGTEKYYDGDDGTNRVYDNHYGIDFSTNQVEDKDVYAAADGTVKAVGWQQPCCGGYGLRAYLYHEEYDQRTVYAHLSSTTVLVSQTVDRGALVGLSGDTGTSSGPHLHFGVYDCDCTTSSEQLDPFGWWSTSTLDVWPYADSHYLWTTSPPSFNLISTTTGTIYTDTTWRGNILVDGTVTVSATATLTVDGAIVKFIDSSSKLVVNGMLDVYGEPDATSSLTYFTSNKDDTVAGDTNYDATSTTPAGADWRSIEVNSGGIAKFRHTIIRDGGASADNGSQANVYNNGGILTMTDATSTDSYNYGVRTDSGTTTCTRCELSNQWTAAYHAGGNTTITDSYIHNNGYFGVFGKGAGTLTIEDTTFSDHNLYGAGYVSFRHGLTFEHSGNSSNNSESSMASNLHGFLTNGYVGSSLTWKEDTLPYVIYPYLIGANIYGTRVPGGSTLTIDPGVVVKFASSTGYMSASGTISAIGTSEDPIYFTSIKDDTVGGDTNDDDDDTSPARGDWLGLVFGSSGVSGTGTLKYMVARYGGGYQPGAGDVAIIENHSSVLTIASSTITESGYAGVWHVTSSGNTTVNKSNLTNVDFYYGMYSSESTASDAENNYWGASDGPKPSGSGVWAVGVDYTPYETSEVSW